METKRESWGSNIGFVMAAVGSAVGLGNIWGFPYKMGKSGGFTFLLVYVLLAVFVGMIIMVSELALGRKTGLGVVGAYRKVSKRYGWIGWLGVLSPFLIMSFYAVLGGYCIQYMALNLAELSFGLSRIFGGSISGTNTFDAMLHNPFGCVLFTALFMLICMAIVKGGVANGIEKFNKIGMPALFFMLVVIIIKAWTLPGAFEGLKFMFVPGYAVKAGFIEQQPKLLEVLGTAGGQMFFSLSLAMGAMVTYGSYLDKKENIVKNSGVIVLADTIVALMAGLAVIPAAVANGIASGTAMAEIKLSGPSLLFVTLQDVFANMGETGPLFGAIFYLLVIIAAISSAISLMEAVGGYFIDRAAAKGKTPNRTKVTIWVSVAIMAEALLVAIDGLGASGIFHWPATGTWNADFLDFMDCWSEGIAMPLGALLMSLMIGWELKPDFILGEVGGSGKRFSLFYSICIQFIVPLAMMLVFAGQIKSFFPVTDGVSYAISGAVLVVFWVLTLIGSRKKENVE